MFIRSKFNGDISQWNVSNVTNMKCILLSKFNGDISKCPSVLLCLICILCFPIVNFMVI